MRRTAETAEGERRWRATAVLLCAASLMATGPVLGQDTAPRLPFGSVAVVLPVQSSLPSAGGKWPGRAASEEEAVEAMDAELAFALAERRGSGDWALPDDLRRRVRRNPMLDVDPDRVAFQGLLNAPGSREQIYEPLHGELRTLAALFGTRFVVLPLRLQVTPIRGETLEIGADAAAQEAPAPCADGAPRQRPELLLALIDIRRSSVLWHGTVQGKMACAEDGGLLAGLAATVASHLTES